MYNVGDWLEFAYVNRQYEYAVWTGQIKKIMTYDDAPKRTGYLMNTKDGCKHFKVIRMSNVNLVKRPE
jgi:hypothetical protein